VRQTATAIREIAASARQPAQATVEWVIGAAVLAFVGLAAWTTAGGAITAAVTRLVGMLAQAGA
jgi:hypothetical protein